LRKLKDTQSVIQNLNIDLRNVPTRLAAASDTIYQLLAYGRWFSPGTPASSITKTDRHDIAEILLKVKCIFVARTVHVNICTNLRYERIYGN
jgi:hypothetical protein